MIRRRRMPALITCWIFATVGCSTPIARQVYTPLPVESNKRVRAAVREVHRGKLGGVVVIEITNLADEPLAEAHGSAVGLQLENGAKARPLKHAEYQQLVDLSGPIAMGFKDWSQTDLPVTLDPLGSVVNLQKDEVALLYVGFDDSVRGNKLTIDLAPALVWRNVAGRTSKLDQALPVVVSLPEVPNSKLPTKDAWRKIPINFAISSDGF